jgi:hypothetical protein
MSDFYFLGHNISNYILKVGSPMLDDSEASPPQGHCRCPDLEPEQGQCC